MNFKEQYYQHLKQENLRLKKENLRLKNQNKKLLQEIDDEGFEYVGMADGKLDRWVKQNYGEDMDWEFDVRKERRGEYCHAKVRRIYEDYQIGIVIVPKEDK